MEKYAQGTGQFVYKGCSFICKGPLVRHPGLAAKEGKRSCADSEARTNLVERGLGTREGPVSGPYS